MTSKSLVSLVSLSLAVGAAVLFGFAPTASAACGTNVGVCDGSCGTNVGICGDDSACGINVGYCDGHCTWNVGVCTAPSCSISAVALCVLA